MNFCSGEMAPSKLLVSMACWASLSKSLRGFATLVDFDGADCGEREAVADCAAAGSAAAIEQQQRNTVSREKRIGRDCESESSEGERRSFMAQTEKCSLQ